MSRPWLSRVSPRAPCLSFNGEPNRLSRGSAAEASCRPPAASQPSPEASDSGPYSRCRRQRRSLAWRFDTEAIAECQPSRRLFSRARRVTVPLHTTDIELATWIRGLALGYLLHRRLLGLQANPTIRPASPCSMFVERMPGDATMVPDLSECGLRDDAAD